MRTVQHTLLTLLGLLWVSPVGAKTTWKPMKVTTQETQRSVITAKIKKELGKAALPLLKFPYLMRIRILGGGGPNRMSETVLLFPAKAQKAFVRATSDLQKRSAIMVSDYKSCRWSAKLKRNHCPGAGVAHEGVVDVTGIQHKKTVLVVSRAKAGYKAQTIFWMGYTTPVKNPYYYPFTMKQFGLDMLSAQVFTVKPDTTPGLPPVPPALGEPMGPKTLPEEGNPTTPREPTPPAQPKGKGVPPTKPQVSGVAPHTPLPTKRPLSFTPFKGGTYGPSLKSAFASDYLNSLYTPSLEQLYWVRIQVSGLDYKGGGPFRVKLPQAPARVFLYAWTDTNTGFSTSVGDRSSCTQPGLKGCPFMVNGTKWYNFSSLIKTDTLELRSFPQKTRMGSFILWVGLQKPGRVHYQAPGFRGKAMAFTRQGRSQGVSGSGGKGGLGTTIVTVSPQVSFVDTWQLSRELRRWSLRPDDTGLLGYSYVLKLTVIPSKRSTLQEVVFNMGTKPAVVLAQSYPGNSRYEHGYAAVQLGRLSACRGRGKSVWCPYHFHKRGWKDLTAGFGFGKSKLVLRNRDSGTIRQVTFWMAFAQRPKRSFRVELFPGSGVGARPSIRSRYYKVSRRSSYDQRP